MTRHVHIRLGRADENCPECEEAYQRGYQDGLLVGESNAEADRIKKAWPWVPDDWLTDEERNMEGDNR